MYLQRAFHRYIGFGQVWCTDCHVSASAMYQQVLRCTPIEDSNRWFFLHQLACLLSMRFHQTGQIVDVEDAIMFSRHLTYVLHLIPQDHTCNHLGNCLSDQFQQLGQLEDVEEAILLHNEALTLHPSPHLHRSDSLNDLAKF
jgi:hypothetical protein